MQAKPARRQREFVLAFAAPVAVAALAFAADVSAQPTRAAEALAVYAAGSLRAPLTELARGFESESGVAVALTFGASGLLKDRIVAGEAAQVFASANMTHPQALHAAGKADAAVAFARNALCALATPAFSLQGKPLAQRLADTDVRIGISTPLADPSGDYAFALFERIESSGAGAPGTATALKTRAMQLTGGPNSPPPPTDGRNAYAALVAEGRADVFITYCTNAAQARQEKPDLQIIGIPDEINVAATYGIATIRPTGAAAARFVAFVLAPQGQRILAGHGFGAP